MKENEGIKKEGLSQELCEKITVAKKTGIYTDVSCSDSSVVRRVDKEKDRGTVWRPAFVHDTDKILHCPYYGRYADKTQVYSLYKNDDITRRSLHVQLVSRIARTIGAALHLNLDLIEAIALGHDMGHPPFAHTGETYLNELYHKKTGRFFLHNLQSVRVLDVIFPYNISLQTLDGIAGHNGEIECEVLYPQPLEDFAQFDRNIERCYTDADFAQKLMPSTLEGAVVRLCDIIAYLGKDRQDAVRTNMAHPGMFMNDQIGSLNSEIINNLMVNVIENSYGKSYIKLDDAHFKALQQSKRDNYRLIYNTAAAATKLDLTVKPMMAEMYGQLLDDLKNGVRTSPIFTHHIDYVNETYAKRSQPYGTGEPNQIVTDCIASMTDDFFVAAYGYLFPESKLKVEYRSYFD